MSQGFEHEQPNSFDRGKNFLLIIAIDNYSNDLPKLKNCKEDANSLKKKLIEKFNFEEDNTETLFDEEASRKGILNKLKEIKDKIDVNDSLFISFSGHGTVVEGKFGYWIPCDASMKEDADYISNHDIADRLDQIACRHIFLMIDACFSGSIFATYRNAQTYSSEGRNSRLGLSASHKDEEASDGRPGTHSPFMKKILRYLDEADSPFSIQELGTQIALEVEEETEGKQSPVFGRLRLEGDNNGRYVIYPRNTIFKFTNVLKNLQNGQKEKAIIELKNFLKVTEGLPEGYTELLSFVANRVKRIQKLRIEELDTQRFTGKQEKLVEIEDRLEFNLIKTINLLLTDPEKRPISKNKDILELVAKDEMEEALYSLIKKYNSNSSVCRNANLLLFQIRLLKDEKVRTNVIDEFELYYERIIISFIFLLRTLEYEKGTWVPRLKLIQELLLKDSLEEAIFVVEDFIKYDLNQETEFALLLKTLNRNLKPLFERELLRGLNYEENTQKSRLKEGLFYILENVEKLYAFENQLEHIQPELSKKSKGTILLGIQKGQFLNILNQEFIPQDDDFINRLRSDFVEIKRRKNKEVLESYIKSSFLLMKSFVIYIDLFKDKKIKTLSSTAPVYFFQEEKLKDKEIGVDEIKESLRFGNIKEAFYNLTNLQLDNLNAERREFLQYKFDLNLEDKFFTNKDFTLISERENKYIGELLNFLVAVG